jgi:metal-responsive CopG/Arc/MetJ family transcriptional regulator
MAVLKCNTACYSYIMSTSRSRRSRVFTISFPEDLAKQVDRMAKQESRNISELFREAFRAYRLRNMHMQLDSARATAQTRKPQAHYTQEDIERFVDEVRSSRKSKA